MDIKTIYRWAWCSEKDGVVLATPCSHFDHWTPNAAYFCRPAMVAVKNLPLEMAGKAVVMAYDAGCPDAHWRELTAGELKQLPLEVHDERDQD